MHAPAKGGRDVRKRPEREARDSPPPQIIHARLRHAEASRGIRLGPAVFINQRRDLAHQSGAQTRVRRLLRRVGLRIPHAGVACDLPLAQFTFFQLGKARLRGVDVAFRCGLRLLLEGMKNLNRIRQARGMDQAKGAGFMPHPNLFHAFADRCHRFAVIGLDAALQTVNLPTPSARTTEEDFPDIA